MALPVTHTHVYALRADAVDAARQKGLDVSDLKFYLAEDYWGWLPRTDAEICAAADALPDDEDEDGPKVYGPDDLVLLQHEDGKQDYGVCRWGSAHDMAGRLADDEGAVINVVDQDTYEVLHTAVPGSRIECEKQIVLLPDARDDAPVPEGLGETETSAPCGGAAAGNITTTSLPQEKPERKMVLAICANFSAEVQVILARAIAAVAQRNVTLPDGVTVDVPPDAVRSAKFYHGVVEACRHL